MRILYLLPSLGVGGAEKQALATAERMEARGHTVAVVTLLPRLADEWPTGVRVESCDVRKNPLSVLAGLFRARRLLRQFQPDLIHSHSYPANLFARLLRLLVPDVVAISTVHNVYEGGWVRMAAYRLSDGLSRRTVAVSEAARERFVRLKAVPAAKCRVILNGIDENEYLPEVERRRQMRAEMGVKAGGDFVWISTGRIAPAKDYPNLLRAFALARRQIPVARLWVAGGDPHRGLPALQQLAGDLGIGDAVEWLGLRRDLPALLDAADAFVMGSAWEGMPLAVGEAMAMAKPVVVTDVGGVRELVGEAGVVVEARNPAALAGAMTATMNMSEEERAALGRAARERIAARFSMDATAEAWEALYREVLAERRNSAPARS